MWCKERAGLTVVVGQKKIDQTRNGAVQLDKELLRAAEVNFLAAAFDGVNDPTRNIIRLIDCHSREVGVLRDLAGDQPGSRRAGREVTDDDAGSGQFSPQRFTEQAKSGL